MKTLPDKDNLPKDVYYCNETDIVSIFDKGKFLMSMCWGGYVQLLNHPLIEKAYNEKGE